MPEGIYQETDKRSVNVREEIYNEIRYIPGKDKSIVLEQVKILKNLPEDIVELAYAHLQSEYKNETIYQEKHSLAQQQYFSDSLCVEGYVNEVMANIQIRQTQPELRGNNTPETRKELDRYESKILEVANDPERYGQQWHVGRNPDVAWLDLDDQGRIIIKGVGEITTSHQLNKRKYLQLCESGFAQSLRQVANHLNNLENGEIIGLPEFGRGKKQLEVAPKLKKYLIVHRDFDASPEGLPGSIGRSVADAEYTHLDQREKKKVFSDTEKQSFVAILNSSDTVIIKSVFNNKENEAITNYLLKKIQEKYPSYKLNNNHGR